MLLNVQSKLIYRKCTNVLINFVSSKYLCMNIVRYTSGNISS